MPSFSCRNSPRSTAAFSGWSRVGSRAPVRVKLTETVWRTFPTFASCLSERTSDCPSSAARLHRSPMCFANSAKMTTTTRRIVTSTANLRIDEPSSENEDSVGDVWRWSLSAATIAATDARSAVDWTIMRRCALFSRRIN